MSSQIKAEPKQLQLSEELKEIEKAMAEWLKQQVEDGEFELAWAGAGSLIGGGLINIDSEEELDIVIYG